MQTTCRPLPLSGYRARPASRPLSRYTDPRYRLSPLRFRRLSADCVRLALRRACRSNTSWPAGEPSLRGRGGSDPVTVRAFESGGAESHEVVASGERRALCGWKVFARSPGADRSRVGGGCGLEAEASSKRAGVRMGSGAKAIPVAPWRAPLSNQPLQRTAPALLRASSLSPTVFQSARSPCSVRRRFEFDRRRR